MEFLGERRWSARLAGDLSSTRSSDRDARFEYRTGPIGSRKAGAQHGADLLRVGLIGRQSRLEGWQGRARGVDSEQGRILSEVDGKTSGIRELRH